MFLRHIVMSKAVLHFHDWSQSKCIPWGQTIAIQTGSYSLKLCIILRELTVLRFNLQHWLFCRGYFIGVPNAASGVEYQLVGLSAMLFHFPRLVARAGPRLHPSCGWMRDAFSTACPDRWRAWVRWWSGVEHSSFWSGCDPTLTCPGSQDISALYLALPGEQLELPLLLTSEHWPTVSSNLRPSLQIVFRHGSSRIIPHGVPCLFHEPQVSSSVRPICSSDCGFCIPSLYGHTRVGQWPPPWEEWYLPVVQLYSPDDCIPSVPCSQVQYIVLLSSAPPVLLPPLSLSPRSLSPAGSCWQFLLWWLCCQQTVAPPGCIVLILTLQRIMPIYQYQLGVSIPERFRVRGTTSISGILRDFAGVAAAAACPTAELVPALLYPSQSQISLR